MTLPSPNHFAGLFTAYFRQLVLLLRRQAGDIAAQKLALRSAMAVLPRGPVEIEAGIEHSEVPDETSLQARLLVHRVDSLQISADAPAAEVLQLARLLAADQGSIASSSHIAVHSLRPSGVRGDLHPVAPATTEPGPPLPPLERHRTMAGPQAEAETLLRALEQEAAGGRWMEALHAAQALVRMTPRFPPHEQRGHLIALRRAFTRTLLDEFIQFAMRATEEQGRVSEILLHAGPEGIEIMVDHVGRSEVIGPRRFVHEALTATPAALPMLLPLLHSPRWHEVRHGAELLGRLGLPEAIEPLRAALDHPDERVRKTVIEALARFSHSSVVAPIRRALADAAPSARASAAFALAERNSPGLALPLLVALESEKNSDAWEALVVALARIDSNETVGALVGIALDKRSLLKAGRPMSQRLAVVRALARSKTESGRKGLERLAAEGFGQVRQAASAALDEKPS